MLREVRPEVAGPDGIRTKVLLHFGRSFRYRLRRWMVRTWLGERRHARLHLHHPSSQGSIATDAWPSTAQARSSGISGVHGFLYSGGTPTPLSTIPWAPTCVARRMQGGRSNLNPV